MLPQPWIVLKFGGTSVSRRERWQTIARLMRERAAEGNRVLTVVSALSGVTDRLKAIAEADPADANAQRLIDELDARHRRFAAELELDRSTIDPWLTRLHALAADTRRLAGDYYWQAELMALGELLSSTLGAAFLRRQGIDAVWIDAREHLLAQAQPNAGAWAQALSVNCQVHPNPELAKEFAGGHPFAITQGFIARDLLGHTVLLGRGGSDTSASHFGALLGARRVEIWTDVPGMFSANPKQVPSARLLRRLDYDEAQEIATTGAKVLHPRCIDPVRQAGVPLWVKDTERPELPGTEVVPRRGDEPQCVKALSSRVGITLVSMETIGMWQQVGFLADVFAAFKRHGLSVDLIGSSETNVTVSLDPSENLIDDATLEWLCRDLAAVCRVKVIAPCAAITLVGRGMRSFLHRLSPLLAELGTERVHLITQSSNDLNLTVVVDQHVVEGLLPRLHELLIQSRAMAIDDEQCFGPRWDELAATGASTPAPRWWQSERARLLELARHSAPCQVYALSEVARRAEALRALPAVTRWYYAMKANPHPAILRTVAERGFGIECVSIGELEHARAAVPTLPAERFLFTPNFAPREEYAHALASGVQVTLDATHGLEHWPELWRDRALLLRVDLGYGHGHHDKVRTGGAQSKFGLAIDELPWVAERCRALGARVIGLHAHLGSGILDHRHWRAVAVQLAGLTEAFPEARILDLGGGLGVPARARDPALDLIGLDRALDEFRQSYPHFELWLEPGRYLVAEAGVLLARVTQTKTKAGVRFVGLETGMNSLLRPALYDAYHGIHNLSRMDAEPLPGTWVVVGPICESGVSANCQRAPKATSS
jgi:diaminopimelate decarboxylase/aspartate kinase